MSHDTLEHLLASIESGDLEKSAEENKEATNLDSSGKVEPVFSASADLEQLLTKQASDKEANINATAKDTPDMNKQASEQGQVLADLIIASLTKEAGENMVIDQSASLVTEQDSQTELTPVDGKSVTDTLKAIAARGASNGAVSPNALTDSAMSDTDECTKTPALTNSDGNSVETEATSDLSKAAAEDELQKIAAVATLMDEGVCFDEAVNLVKVAEAELISEEAEQIKQAAVASLINEGLDIESAVALVKQAAEVLEDEAKKEDKKDDKKEDKKEDKKDDKKNAFLEKLKEGKKD